MKTNVTITLDIALVVEARMRKVKFSEIFNSYLNEYLETKRTENPDFEGEIARLKAILTEKELELEEQRSKNIKDRSKLMKEGKMIRI